MDWIESIKSAWTGHRLFAEWLVKHKQPELIVELGVDYGYSSFVFANALKKNSKGKIIGIDLFLGDQHAGIRNTHDFVIDKIKTHGLNTLEIVKADFAEYSKTWSTPIDILHIDGLHTYEAVKSDFEHWSPFVKENGIILFHDVCIPQFGIKDFFRQLGGYKLYFTHSAGLGIYTKDKELYETILKTFKNVVDFKVHPI